MSDADAFGKRERALEDEFFHRTDKALLERMRQSMEREQSREALAAATGIRDPALLDALLDRGIQPTTLVALTLVPAVFVAWADSELSDEERKAVLEAAAQRGITPGTVSYDLLSSWLEQRPRQSLWTTWKEYFRAVYGALEPATQKTLHDEITAQARTVAKASGGLLGVGRVSAEEQKLLDEIEQTLRTAP